jgi:uncharacterized protein
MPDFKKMNVERLRELARKALGPGSSRLKTKAELVNALEEAGATPGSKGAAVEKPAARVRAAAARAGEPGKIAKTAAGEPAKAARRPAGSAAKPARTATSKAAAKVGQAKEAAAAGGKRMAAKATRAAGKAVKAAAAAVAAVEVVVDEVRKGTRRVAAAGLRRRSGEGKKAGPDPEGYFVARVRGEDAARAAPHPLTESDADEAPDLEEATPSTSTLDEDLGDLPWGYEDDAFVALPRDPRTLYLYWDHSNGAVAHAFGGLDHPRAQLWVFARVGDGWERVRVVEFALEARGYYVHDLDPGRVYRAEIHVVDRQGQDRLVGAPSNETVLPPVGPSPLVDDRFIRIPWSVSLGRLLGPGHAGGPFSEEARALLARLSDWSRFASKAVWGGSAGESGERPSSPTSAASAPSSPSSPAGGFGRRE